MGAASCVQQCERWRSSAASAMDASVIAKRKRGDNCCIVVWVTRRAGRPYSQQDVMCIFTASFLLKHSRWCKCLSLTDKATHPTNRQEDWEYIIGFCDQINKELEGYVCHMFIFFVCLFVLKYLISFSSFLLQSSDSCASARPQNPLATRMGSSSGSDSEKRFISTKQPFLFFFVSAIKSKR